MSWKESLPADVLPWLLEESEPGPRYLALRDLLDLPADDATLDLARRQAHQTGPVATVLNAMQPEGFWVKAGPGYGPKYRSSVWAHILLGQTGARIECDERIERACSYLLDHGLAPGGQFSYNGAPGGTFDCLQGNLCTALLETGCQDPRLEAAFEWMARTVTGAGLAPASERKAPQRYYAYKCGPGFACGANQGKACAWGATKVMLAFARLPVERRTPLIQEAIARGVDFLFSVDPVGAAYPTPNEQKPSGDWWKFGFPVFYITDLLQVVEALVGLGYGCDPRLANALALVHSKQDSQGRWALEYNYASKTWGNYGPKNKPNKWVTWRALRVLKAVEMQRPL